MKKNTLLTILVTVVILLNVALLLNMWLGRPGGHKPVHLRIVEDIGFDKEQLAKFDKLRDSVSIDLNDVEKRLDDAIFSYFSLLKTKDWNPATKDSLQSLIGELKKEKASILFTHFKEVKAICRPDQLQEFNLVLDQMMGLINPPPPHH